MEPKKILITGGLWYIGSHTATLFSQAGYDVVLLDNLSNTHKDEVLSSLKILTNKDLPFYEGTEIHARSKEDFIKEKLDLEKEKLKLMLSLYTR